MVQQSVIAPQSGSAMETYTNFGPYSNAGDHTSGQDYPVDNYIYENPMTTDSGHTNQANNNTMHRPWEAMSNSHSPDSGAISANDSPVYSAPGAAGAPATTISAEEHQYSPSYDPSSSAAQRLPSHTTPEEMAVSEPAYGVSHMLPQQAKASRQTSVVVRGGTSAMSDQSHQPARLFERLTVLMGNSSSRLGYQSKELSDFYAQQKGELDAQLYAELEAASGGINAGYGGGSVAYSNPDAIRQKYEVQLAGLNKRIHHRVCLLEMSEDGCEQPMHQLQPLPPPYPQAPYASAAPAAMPTMPYTTGANAVPQYSYGGQNTSPGGTNAVLQPAAMSGQGYLSDDYQHQSYQHSKHGLYTMPLHRGEDSRYSPTTSNCSYTSSSDSLSPKKLHHAPSSLYAHPDMGTHQSLMGCGREDSKPLSSSLGVRRHQPRLTRKSKHLNAKVVEAMNAWYERHTEYPYPDYDTVQQIANMGPISMEQVKKWFCNKRTRSNNTRKLKDIAELRRKFLPETVKGRLKGFEGH